MTFTQNQTRHFYVVNNVVAENGSLTHPGDIKFYGTFGQPHFYFEYMSPNGIIVRSDMIDGGMNHSVKAYFKDAAKLGRQTKGTVIVADSNLLNNGNIINGQDYLVNIRIMQYYFKSDLHYEWKHGVVHGAGNMSVSDFYARMAMSLFSNFSREPWPILKFGLTESVLSSPDQYDITNDSAHITWINKSTKLDTLLGQSYTGIVIDEELQDWHIGKMEMEPVIYDVHCDYIVYSGDEMLWGSATEIPGGTFVTNSREIADMEWFYHGERGDIYREYAYPSNIDFMPVANSNFADGYSTVDIHYYWQGANHAIQKSEKDITLAFPGGGDGTVGRALAAVFTEPESGKVKPDRNN